MALGLAACRAGLRVRFFTAAGLVSLLEKEQKQYTLDRFLSRVRQNYRVDISETPSLTISKTTLPAHCIYGSPRCSGVELYLT